MPNLTRSRLVAVVSFVAFAYACGGSEFQSSNATPGAGGSTAAAGAGGDGTSAGGDTTSQGGDTGAAGDTGAGDMSQAGSPGTAGGGDVGGTTGGGGQAGDTGTAGAPATGGMAGGANGGSTGTSGAGNPGGTSAGGASQGGAGGNPATGGSGVAGGGTCLVSLTPADGADCTVVGPGCIALDACGGTCTCAMSAQGGFRWACADPSGSCSSPNGQNCHYSVSTHEICSCGPLDNGASWVCATMPACQTGQRPQCGDTCKAFGGGCVCTGSSDSARLCSCQQDNGQLRWVCQ